MTGPSIPTIDQALTVKINGSAAAAIEACRRSLARESYLQYVCEMSRQEGKAFLVGTHTKVMAERIDRALDDMFLYRKSSYLRISVPFRHGKAIEVNEWQRVYGKGFVRIKDVQVGDYVPAPDGTWTKVVAKSPVFKDRPLFAVTTAIGWPGDNWLGPATGVLVDGEHEWVVQINGGTEFQTLDTKTLHDLEASGSTVRVSHCLTPDAEWPGFPARCLHFRAQHCRGDTQCLQVEHPSHQFLTGTGYIPTHNSLLFSRYLPAYIAGKFCVGPSRRKHNPHNIDVEEILTSYASGLSDLLSRESRQILTSGANKALFPHVGLSREASSVCDWQAIDLSNEDRVIFKMQAMGLGGSVTGRGACILVVDDPIRNREDAESQTIRDKAWDSLTNDYLSRLAPVHIVFLVGTRWHIDDPIGRVRDRNDPTSEKYDPSFPHFEAVEFKAVNDDGTYLFPERFPPEWYKAQFATLGAYSAAALLQGDPIAKGGNLLPADKIQYWDALPPSLSTQARLSCRAWDLASSAKEVSKDDPDWTAGPRGFIFFDDSAKPSDDEDTLRGKAWFVITDCRAVRAVAGPRNELIVSTAKEDGAVCWQVIEGVAGYKDSATMLQSVLRGLSVVHKVTVHKDKYTRIEALHPLMDAGRMVFLKGPWNLLASQQISQFPGGKHDDIPDALATLYTKCLERSIKALRAGYFQATGAAGRGWVDIDDKNQGDTP